MNIPVLTPVRFYATLAVLGALLTAIGLQTVRLAEAHEKVDKLETAAAKEGERQALAVATAVQAERNEEDRRRAAQQKVIDNAEAQHQKDLGSLVALSHERDLRVRDLAAYVAAHRQTSSNPLVAGSSQPASVDPVDLLAGLYGRADDAAGVLAEYADELHRRLVACVGAYHANEEVTGLVAE